MCLKLSCRWKSGENVLSVCGVRTFWEASVEFFLLRAVMRHCTAPVVRHICFFSRSRTVQLTAVMARHVLPSKPFLLFLTLPHAFRSLIAIFVPIFLPCLSIVFPPLFVLVVFFFSLVVAGLPQVAQVWRERLPRCGLCRWCGRRVGSFHGRTHRARR